jgi:dihydroorotate dehydrogenase
MLYKKLVKPILFSLDPEVAHQVVLTSAALLSRLPIALKLVEKILDTHQSKDPIRLFGLDFANRIGLAAGFDKNCEAFGFMQALGFGHVETGTVTNLPQFGNERPRLWRLPQDAALINRLGFPSEGVEAVLERLRPLAAKPRRSILGVNIGKNKVVAIDQAVDDYVSLFNKVSSYGDYFVLNVSSPNTPELRKLQEPERLKALFSAIKNANVLGKPVLVKLAPDLSQQDLQQSVETVLACGVSGLIVSNTTSSREGLSMAVTYQGGLSGLPLFAKALGCVRLVSDVAAGAVPIIGVGGISTPEHVSMMLEAGASLVQLYTGMVYEGPGLVKKLIA